MEKESKKFSKKPAKIKKADYILLKDVSIGGKIIKKGKKVYLTEVGRKSFKKLNYI